jgi:hypothetical protein
MKGPWRVVAIGSRSVLVTLFPVQGIETSVRIETRRGSSNANPSWRAPGLSHMIGIGRGFSAALGDMVEQDAFGPGVFRREEAPL